MNSTTADDIRTRIVGVLNKPIRPYRNLSPEEEEALKRLRCDKSIVILPADKGRSTVVMDLEEYDKKMLSIVNDVNTYNCLKKDPSSTLQSKMNSLLLTQVKKDELPQNLYQRLRRSDATTPQIYGLPKIHKLDAPLRPIVSFYSSPTYHLSKHLSLILSPLVGNSISHVRNSCDFVTFVTSHQLEDEIMVSFDVVSLFTKVPTKLAIQVARQRLEEDANLTDRTTLSIDNIICLLEFCLDATYFSFKGKYYKQIFSTAMDSPVSVTVANMVMENVEQRALSSFDYKPIFWKRYVDDTFTALPASIVDRFHKHLNSIEPSIQFTVEIEENGRLPFLDVLITRNDDGTLCSSIYRKKTHTDQYLQYSSHHPSSHKQSVARTLFTRASTHSSSLVQRAEEETHIIEALHNNDYPNTFIMDCHKKVQQKRPTPSLLSNSTISDTPPPIRVTIPYVQGQSEAIRWILRSLDIQVIFRPLTTLRRMISRPKDPLPVFSQTGVVYNISCQDCSSSYVGQTGRSLQQCIKEHQRAVQQQNTSTNALAEHAWHKGHKINWDNPTILAHHPYLMQRCILESWHIHRHKGTINREQAPIPQIYLTFQNKVHEPHPTHVPRASFPGTPV